MKLSLHIAAKAGGLGAVSLLVGNGADPAQCDEDGLVQLLAMLPATFFYVSLGSVAATGVETAVGTGDFDPSPLEWGLRIVGIAATAAVVILVTRLARKTLRETTDIEETETP